MPAQLTMTCGTPKASVTDRVSASTDAALPTSVSKKRASGAPAILQAVATALPRFVSRPATATRNPSSAKRIAIAWPIPEVPPITARVRISGMVAVPALDVEEFGHSFDLKVHHRPSRLDSAADLLRLTQQSRLGRLHDDVYDGCVRR